MRKFLKIGLIGFGMLALLAVVAWLVMSVLLIRKISSVHDRAEVRSVERVTKPGKRYETDEKLLAAPEAAILNEPISDEFRDYEAVKNDPVKSGYLFSRSLIFSHYALKTRESQNLRPLCSMVCDPTSFDPKRADRVGPMYLEDFLFENGERAFEDFYFRHMVEGMNFMSYILGQDMLATIMAAYRGKMEGTLSQAALAVQLNYQVARFVGRYDKIAKDMDIWIEEMKALDELPKSCGEKSLSEIQDRCEALMNSPAVHRMWSTIPKD